MISRFYSQHYCTVYCVQVIVKRLLRNNSNQGGGTLQQLKNLLNRQLPRDPKSDMNSYEDFLLVVGTGHTITAAMELLEMDSIDQDPGAIIPPNITRMSDEAKRRVLKHFTQQFI